MELTPELVSLLGVAATGGFKETARMLGCDEDEAAFEDKLRKIAKGKPPPDDGKRRATKKPGH